MNVYQHPSKETYNHNNAFIIVTVNIWLENKCDYSKKSFVLCHVTVKTVFSSVKLNF